MIRLKAARFAISSALRGADRWPGVARRLVTFFWFRQKKVTKEKATPLIPETPKPRKLSLLGWLRFAY